MLSEIPLIPDIASSKSSLTYSILVIIYSIIILLAFTLPHVELSCVTFRADFKSKRRLLHKEVTICFVSSVRRSAILCDGYVAMLLVMSRYRSMCRDTGRGLEEYSKNPLTNQPKTLAIESFMSLTGL